MAVKFDLADNGLNGILTECLFLKNNNLSKSVRYLLHDTVQGRRFLITDYLEQSVFEYLGQFKGIEYLRKVQEVALQMVDAVHEMHSKGYIHRDIKTENFRVQGG